MLSAALNFPLRENCPNTKFFPGPYFTEFSPNTRKYEPEKTPYLDIYRAVFLFLYFFRAGKKLVAIMNEIELACRQHTAESNGNFVQPLLYPAVPSLLSSKQRKQMLQFGCMVEGKLLTNNLEVVSSLKLFRLGQVS